LLILGLPRFKVTGKRGRLNLDWSGGIETAAPELGLRDLALRYE
jgi:hypothetical protein